MDPQSFNAILHSHEPESWENPHWRTDKLDKEKSSGKVGGQVEEGVGVVEKVGHAWKDFMNPNN